MVASCDDLLHSYFVESRISKGPFLTLIKNTKGFATGTNQIWIQLVQIDLEQFKKLLYTEKQGWLKNLGF